MEIIQASINVLVISIAYHLSKNMDYIDNFKN